MSTLPARRISLTILPGMALRLGAESGRGCSTAFDVVDVPKEKKS